MKDFQQGSVKPLTVRERARRETLTEKWIFGTATMGEIYQARILNRRVELLHRSSTCVDINQHGITTTKGRIKP